MSRKGRKGGRGQWRGAPRPRNRRRRWWLAGGLAVIAVAAFAAWSLWPVPDPGGTPRLVLDRTQVDLGYLAFETPARAVFVLKNTGDGTLRLTEAPRVVLKAGC